MIITEKKNWVFISNIEYFHQSISFVDMQTNLQVWYDHCRTEGKWNIIIYGVIQKEEKTDPRSRLEIQVIFDVPLTGVTELF